MDRSPGAEHLPQRLHVLALEAWMGGSHAPFLEAWQERSAHDIRVEGLAPRHWKWRMSASAWEFGRRIEADTRRPDVLFATDYVDLAQLQTFLPDDWAGLPRLLYMHENQLTYPQRPLPRAGAGDGPRARATGLKHDTSFGFKNILSCIAAGRVLFNSAFHRDEFAQAADELLRGLPKPNPRAELARALERSAVVGPGVDWEAIPLGPGGEPGSPLRLLFNHRWEHDKDPVTFLEAVRSVRSAGAQVEVVALGQNFSELDPASATLLEELSDCVVQRGFVPSRAAYLEALGTCDVVVSSARHEFYGISVLEAVSAGCTPLVPGRLAYPEVLPGELHAGCLYGSARELRDRLERLARDPAPVRGTGHRARLRASVRGERVEAKAAELDRIVAELAAGSRD